MSPTEPSMAEQLGAAAGRPSRDAGPDWSQTARDTSAPAWATGETTDPAPGGDRQDGNGPPGPAGPDLAGPDPAGQDADQAGRPPAGHDQDQAGRPPAGPDATARQAERHTDGHLDPDLAGDVPAGGGPGPEERAAVRTRRGPAGAAGGAGAAGAAGGAAAPHTPISTRATRDDQDWADAPSDDDEDLSTSGAVGQPVIETVLGGTVIAINDDPVA